MKELLVQLSEFFVAYVIYGVHGGLGAAANYLYHHANKGKPFNLVGLIIFMTLGAVTVSMIGPLIPHDMPGRDGLLIAIGFMFSPILDFLDTNGGVIAKRFLKG